MKWVTIHTSRPGGPQFLAPRRGPGRYAFGACDRGLPLTGAADGSCSGDCHPERDAVVA